MLSNSFAKSTVRDMAGPMVLKTTDLPPVRGKLMLGVSLAPYTWFRVGGPADALFLPADEEDLQHFLADLPLDVPLTVLGVGSNTIVRDRGIEGVVVRLAGAYWGEIRPAGEASLAVRPGALDLSVARAAARAGLAGFSFLAGIPGSIGGALRTNAGCYGYELKDVLQAVEVLTRTGVRKVYSGDRSLTFSYRHSDLPLDEIATRLVLRAKGSGEPDMLIQEISELQARREDSQPIREKTGGSTFANPDPPGAPNARSTWRLIDEAGCRGLKVGGAQVSEKHCNFLINTGDATAADLEALGELVRARVWDICGVDLRWEVRRVGRL